MGQSPVAAILIGGTTAASTEGSYAAFSMGFSTGTSNTNQGMFWGWTNILGTARNFTQTPTSAGAIFAPSATASTSLGTSAAVSGFTSASFVSSGTGANVPVGYALISGSDVQAHISTISFSTAVSTGTITSTGMAFQPNALFGMWLSTGSAAASFGVFAAATAAGAGTSMVSYHLFNWTREAAVTGLTARVQNLGNIVQEDLSTALAMSHQVSLPTALTSGFSLHYDQKDAARSMSMAVLALKAPAVQVGLSSFAAATTLWKTTGLGSLISQVLLILSSNQPGVGVNSNSFSIGVATSNGSQLSVSGVGVDAAAPAGSHQSNFSSNKAAAFLTTAGVQVTGVFTTIADGFQIAWSNPTSGSMVYLVLSNAVNDVASDVHSSASISANLTAVQGLSASIVSSALLSANLTAVTVMSADIRSSAAIRAFLQSEFVAGRSKTKADASMSLRFRDGKEQHFRKIESTDSPAFARSLTVNSSHMRIGLAEFNNARILGILPASTNTVPLRITAQGNSGQGLQVSSQGLSVFALSTGQQNDVWLYTTDPSAAIPVRVLLK